MKNLNKFLLPFYSLILIVTLLISCDPNRIHYGVFNYYNKVEDDNTTSYIIKNDGRKVYGNYVSWGNADIHKQVVLDGVKYPPSEVKAFKNKGIYYIRFDSGYIKRFIHGKINVYVHFDERYINNNVGLNNRNIHFKTHDSHSRHYAQIGEDGPLIFIVNRDVLVDLVKDCPLSVSMIGDDGYDKLMDGHRKDIDYMNNIFNIYNNGCKEDTKVETSR
jgi:hypothetical protein